MSKQPKEKKKVRTHPFQRPALADQQEDTDGVRAQPRVKQRQRRTRDDEDGGLRPDAADDRVLRVARAQESELLAEERQTHAAKVANQSDDSDLDEAASYADDDMEEEEITEEEERQFELFMSKQSKERRTIADLIMEKLAERPEPTPMDDGAPATSLDPQLVEVYTGVAKVLKGYRSGKVPKAFKIIPALHNWEEVLFLTKPDEWSNAAFFMGTRIFASNLNEKMAQRFYNFILLERVRDNIQQFKRLNFHLFQAIKKAAYKPGAFFKGLILPLCAVRSHLSLFHPLQSGDCTLREATIVSSAMKQVSLPVLHSAAALLKLCEMEYTGAQSIFIRALLDKKYALPYRVLDALVQHFVRFEQDPREMPVKWHTALLALVQRYKLQFSDEQREALKRLMRVQTHHTLTPEIRRELFSPLQTSGADMMSM